MTKNLRYYLSLPYPVTIEPYKTDEGEIRYNAEIPDLLGCSAWGKTREEAWEKLQEAKDIWLRACLKRNLPIPEPVSEDDFSGKFLLRIPTKLHMILAKQAKANDLSLNQYVKSILEREVTLEYERKRIETRDQEILDEIRQLRDEIRPLKEGVKFIEKENVSTAFIADSRTAAYIEYRFPPLDAPTKRDLHLVRPRSQSSIDVNSEKDVAV
ncbi:MAG: toxin-antitoxin system HicB family antitoxin [bacterium]